MEDTIEQLEDGIYFNLDEEIYQAQNRLSQSGVQNMLISPPLFWARSWLNPDRKEVDKEAKVTGRAYHHARLQPDLYASTYVRCPDVSDYPEGVLKTHNDIKEQFEARGMPKTVKGEKVLDAALRLKDSGYGGPIWPLIEAQAAAEREAAGTVGLSADVFDNIKRDMEFIRANEAVAEKLSDGQAEVSVFWTDDKGTRWKMRTDYLKAQGLSDFKTFANPMGKQLDKCLSDAVMYNRYYIQPVVYLEGFLAIRDGLPIRKIQNQDQKNLVEEIRNGKNRPEFWWIFQEKGDVLNILARKFQLFTKPAPGHDANAAGVSDEDSARVADMTIRQTSVHMKARAEIDYAARMFRFYMEEYADRPWPAVNVVSEIGDDDFPLYWLEK